MLLSEQGKVEGVQFRWFLSHTAFAQPFTIYVVLSGPQKRGSLQYFDMKSTYPGNP